MFTYEVLIVIHDCSQRQTQHTWCTSEDVAEPGWSSCSRVSPVVVNAILPQIQQDFGVDHIGLRYDLEIRLACPQKNHPLEARTMPFRHWICRPVSGFLQLTEWKKMLHHGVEQCGACMRSVLTNSPSKMIEEITWDQRAPPIQSEGLHHQNSSCRFWAAADMLCHPESRLLPWGASSEAWEVMFIKTNVMIHIHANNIHVDWIIIFGFLDLKFHGLAADSIIPRLDTTLISTIVQELIEQLAAIVPAECHFRVYPYVKIRDPMERGAVFVWTF